MEDSLKRLGWRRKRVLEVPKSSIWINYVLRFSFKFFFSTSGIYLVIFTHKMSRFKSITKILSYKFHFQIWVFCIKTYFKLWFPKYIYILISQIYNFFRSKMRIRQNQFGFFIRDILVCTRKDLIDFFFLLISPTLFWRHKPERLRPRIPQICLSTSNWMNII